MHGGQDEEESDYFLQEGTDENVLVNTVDIEEQYRRGMSIKRGGIVFQTWAQQLRSAHEPKSSCGEVLAGEKCVKQTAVRKEEPAGQFSLSRLPYFGRFGKF